MQQARLPPQLRGARARHRALAHARRGELRHDALRAGVDAVRDRAGRARRRATSSPSSASRRSTAPRCSTRSSGCACRASTACSSSPRGGSRRGAASHLPADVPLVAVEAGPADAMPVVAVDQFAGAEARHAAPARPRPPRRSTTSPGRPTGWRPPSGSRAGGPRWRRPAPRCRRSLVGDWSPRSGYELGRRLLRRAGVTAMFVANDQMALGLLRALHEAGREIPARSASSASTTSPRRSTSPRR